MTAPTPAKAVRPPRGSSTVAEPHLLVSPPHQGTAAAARMIGLLAALVPLLSFAAPDRIEDYAAVAALQLHSTEGLQRLELPLAVLQASRSPGYADVRLFDARGEPVPLAWAQRPPGLAGSERRAPVPAFAWPATVPAETGIQVQVDANGAVVRIRSAHPAPPAAAPVPTVWLLDLSRLDHQGERITQLALDWPARPGGMATGVHVEGSDDTRTWASITRGSLLDLAQGGAPALKQVEWPASERAQGAGRWARAGMPRYLRLSFDTPLTLTRAELTLSQAPAEPPLASQRVAFLATEAPPGEPHPWELDLQGPVPVSRLRVHLPQTNTVVPLKLQQRDDARRPWRTVTTLVAWRLTRNGQDLHSPAIGFEAASTRYWQLVPDARSAGWSPASLEATLEWTAPQIVFAARGLGAPEAAAPAPGAAALRLAVGRESRGAPPLTLAALIPSYEPGAEHLLPAASLAALTPQAVVVPPLPERLRQASPADRQRWTLWLALVLAVAGLGWLAWKLVREVKTAR